ncbi:S8 family serine peptidase [Gammaproteobacteria bacterium]|nr:S8 family serine peptidase [Gammaproteobacteria bacterium]
MNKKLLPITLSILFIVSCGGGGGGGGGSTPTTPSTPAPTVNLSADPTSVLLESTSTLTWSSSNATSCSASWTTQTGTSGSETVTITTAGSNSFSISCTGDGGSRSASTTVEGYRNTDGVVVDGYISGAEVFIDEDDDWVLDSNENSTTSDNEGKFTIRYANGNLVSIGGTDLDSQTLLDNLLIMHKLAGHSDFKAVTPVTSVAAFMENASLVNAALGIDLSIDVFSFDPVANKGDGGINDYLYEKGNQLTVLAFALQNITNNLNTTTETTQDYFKAITEEIEKEYTETETRVDIETEAFITKALENVIAAKSVTIDQTAKANVAKALSGMLPIIQVKSSDDLTTGIIRFAVSTLQTDIQAIANGTATAETVSSYTEDLLNYIAEDQSIDSGEIAPDINAITDNVTTSEDTEVEINVLLNDSYVTSSPFSLSATNGTNGSTSVSNNLITFSPDADYNGSDSFSYTLTQGDKTSSADVTVNIEAVNDAPSINIASTIQVEENQTAVTTVSVSDVDEDELTLTLGGTDADSFNLSDENVLTFKEAPDYETKDSYALTLSLTDGIEIVTKDLSIIILDVNYVFSGKVIDGYINGAEIFIDQNFNLTKDDGEFSATSDSDGAFNIDISDESLAACLQKRPIIAEVPVGAIDSSLGEVLSAYQMILPSIEDSIDANAAIFITPFTNLLSDAVIQGINASNIVDEIDVSEGCGDLANSIAINISNELLQISGSIESSLNISFKDLLIDFIQDNSSSTITETSAQRIAAFFPYFKELSDEFDAELSNIHGEIINTNVIIEEDAISSILSSTDIEEMPLSFNAIYETDPNELGWFIQEKIIANGAKVNSDGQIKHHTCFTSSENCITDTRNLDALRNASKRYTRTSTFLNNNYDPENYNYQLVIEDEQRVDFDIDGNPKDRVCIYQNWLYLTPVNTRENFVTNDRYNTGASDGSNNNDDCSDVLANKNEALFVALVDKFDDGIDFEEIDIRITNPIYQNSTFFENKVNNIYQNRNNLDLDPLIQEIASVPRTLKDIENLRAKLTESSTDQISIYWTKRNATGQQLESAKIDIKFDKSKDYFEYGTIENSSTGSDYTVVTSSEGQQAINDIVNILYSNSNVFNSPDYLSYAPIFTSESTFAVDENQIDIGTVTAVDGDDDPITFTISGDDISISTEGVLTFNTAPDFETKTSYTATVTASDGTNPRTQEITVNINNVNDVAPVITSVDSFSVEENQTAIGAVTATDAEGDNVTFTVSGSELAITSAGVLTFISAPDYETKATYSATVTASDGTNASTQDITVNVTNVNDIAPEFTSDATFSAAENQKAIGTVTATDAEGDNVTFTVSGSELAITSAGVLTFISAPDYETKTSYSATVTASDGVNTTTQNITVNITNENDNSPSFTSNATFSADENQTSIGTVTATDADGDDVIFSISGSELEITSAGVLTFVEAPDYETKVTYTATVTASDGTNSSTQDITVNVTNVNDNSPVFTSDATFSADENQTSIGTVTATDADGDTITYSISGTDSESVSINSSSGVLTFNSAPNYESKTSYSIVASASDGVNETNQNVTITINNINEAPAFTSSASFIADENQTSIGSVSVTDPENATLSYSLSGTDASSLGISDSGVLSFGSAPNYESKNSYSATVAASDGTNSSTQDITISITDVNDAPVATAASYYLNLLPQDQSGGDITLGATDEDGDSLTYSIVSDASYGTTSISGSTLTYLTNSSTQSAQTESFSFKVNDGTLDSDAVTITIDLKTDPLYQYQWHLNNTGQTNFATNAGTPGVDLNVDSVISGNTTGSGIVIAVVDDGLEISHEDLVDNVVSGSYDFVNSDNDPTQPDPCTDEDDCVGHGTSVAGIIAAKGWNNIGVRGVAPNASIFGNNYLENSTVTTFAQAHGVNPPVDATADIYNMSYGVSYPNDDDDVQKSTYALPERLGSNYVEFSTLKSGVENLRGGKGAVYIKSSGNDFETQSVENACGTDTVLSCTEATIGAQNQLPYNIVVGAVNANNTKSSYSTPGSSLWVSGYGGEYGYSDIYSGTGNSFDPAIMTVDRSGCSLGNSRSGSSASYGKNRFDLAGQNFTEQLTLNSDCNYLSSFNGTSAAAPTVSGVVALMLEANSDLTWRDVKHILASTSDKIDANRATTAGGHTQYEWITNAAGYQHHNWYGFGIVNAAAAIAAAESYTANSLGDFVNVLAQTTISGSPNIPDNSAGTVAINISKPAGSNGIVEFVKVSLVFSHPRAWSLGFRLTSPSGTTVNLMQVNLNIDDPGGSYWIDFGAAGFYGETMEGDWTLEVRDYVAGIEGTLSNYAIQIYGN